METQTETENPQTETENPNSSTCTPPPTQPQPQPQPPLKKPRMSTTSDDDHTEVDNTAPRKPRYKRRKVAILLAYCGAGYLGMQKNPGAKTIESDLEEALFLSGAVPAPERGLSKRWDWARTARTDKGVSAVAQVVSGRFFIDPPGFVDRLNSNLPDQIRVFGYKRVSPSFSAKKFCDRRRYVYLLPVFALDPTCHRDRESVMASLGSGDQQLIKCSACSDRGRKVEGLMGNKRAPAKIGGDHINADTITEAAGIDCKLEVRSEFSYGDEEKERFNAILKRYEGTRNFHNFTTRTKAEDPAARRYIVSFGADKTVTIEGIEFVWCEVLGQSFMLHQIRKMIGLAVAVMRGCAPESLFDTAFQPDVRINVPTAPEVGLYLDECFFTSYNNRSDSQEEVTMDAYAEAANEFKLTYIFPHIARMEHKYGTVGLWLHSLNHRNYPDLRAPRTSLAADTKAVDSEVVESVDAIEQKVDSAEIVG